MIYMDKVFRIKLPKIFEVISEEEAKKNIESGKYLVILIPEEEIEVKRLDNDE